MLKLLLWLILFVLCWPLALVACAVENNIPPAHAKATDRTGLTWIRVFKIDNGAQ